MQGIFLENAKFSRIHLFFDPLFRKNILLFCAVQYIICVLPCRNDGIGRRAGLKIPWWQHRAGSTPASGTKTAVPHRGAAVFLCLRWENPPNVFRQNHVRFVMPRRPRKTFRRNGLPFLHSTPASGTNKKRQNSVEFCRFLNEVAPLGLMKNEDACTCKASALMKKLK